MDKAEATALLKAAAKSTQMTTVYDLGENGPLVPQVMNSGRMRVTRVIVTVDDTGYVNVEAKGYSVTRDGRKKSRDWHIASYETDQLFAVALQDL